MNRGESSGPLQAFLNFLCLGVKSAHPAPRQSRLNRAPTYSEEFHPVHSLALTGGLRLMYHGRGKSGPITGSEVSPIADY